MPDRPRTWTLHLSLADGSATRVTFGGLPVRVVEWDRERVVPIIEQAQHEWATHFAAGGTRPLSDFVFDALTGGDDSKEDGGDGHG